MSPYAHPELHENFLNDTSKVDELANVLQQIIKDDKSIPLKDYSTEVTNTSFCVLQENAFRQFHTSAKMSKKIRKYVNTNQISFMRQIDVTKEVRQLARRDRIIVATSFRR